MTKRYLREENFRMIYELFGESIPLQFKEAIRSQGGQIFNKLSRNPANKFEESYIHSYNLGMYQTHLKQKEPLNLLPPQGQKSAFTQLKTFDDAFEKKK